ncbi:hypothetical protein CTEN210_00332 [Chaetoceros tenuissimus]|uniref:Pentapeptide repeat-containing protein n=1 Tax=Chaetoceros tenuissimus TaxID=426638 RepID=A0AAD3CFC2_9STRA|nr:hypothetical protein CTEN210_00332 [Chaetoceros tenuissimus]
MRFISCLLFSTSAATAFQTPQINNKQLLQSIQQTTASVTAAASILTIASSPANAVSGGGLDYANLDITGQDFSNNSKTYKGKDFTQVIAKGTNFSGSNLQGCRFYKAFLVNTNFEGADLRGAALEDTSMDGANLKNAIASGTYFSASLLDVATAENADFTDASIPPKTLARFCDREDVKGTNPVTGNDTRDTLFCP